MDTALPCMCLIIRIGIKMTKEYLMTAVTIDAIVRLKLSLRELCITNEIPEEQFFLRLERYIHRKFQGRELFSLRDDEISALIIQLPVFANAILSELNFNG